MTARNRELLGVVPASLLVTAGFAGVFIQRSNALSNISLTYGAIFLGLCLAGHLVIRATLPHADPYMFPLVALLSSFGIVMIYRTNATDARQQAQWFVLGLILFAATIIGFRDYRKLERYRYTIAAVSLFLLIFLRLPGIGYQVNGAYLGIRIPGLFVLPADEARQDRLRNFSRQLPARHPPGARSGRAADPRRDDPAAQALRPRPRDLGPRDGDSLLHDVGSSLMFYGALLSILYVATSRVSFVVVGLIAFGLGAWYIGAHVPHINARVQEWLHPLNPTFYSGKNPAQISSYQLANSMFAQAAAVCSARASARPR